MFFITNCYENTKFNLFIVAALKCYKNKLSEDEPEKTEDFTKSGDDGRMYCWSAKTSDGMARSGIQLSDEDKTTIGISGTKNCISDFLAKVGALISNPDLLNKLKNAMKDQGIEEAKFSQIQEVCHCEKDGCNGQNPATKMDKSDKNATNPEGDSKSSNGETKVDAKKSIMFLMTTIAFYFSN